MTPLAVGLWAVGVYVAVGIVIAGAFLLSAVTRVLGHPAPVTVGARILLFPGAVALWPVIAARWLRTERRLP